MKKSWQLLLRRVVPAHLSQDIGDPTCLQHTQHHWLLIGISIVKIWIWLKGFKGAKSVQKQSSYRNACNSYWLQQELCMQGFKLQTKFQTFQSALWLSVDVAPVKHKRCFSLASLSGSHAQNQSCNTSTVNITGECLHPFRMDYSELSNIMTTFILVTVKHFGGKEREWEGG